MKKKRKLKTARDAQRIKVQTIEGGFGNGFDRTERVIVMDTVTAMFRRRQLTIRQFETAEYFRRAFEFSGGVPSSMNGKRRGGSQPHTRMPAQSQLWAASVLNDTARILGELDGRIFRMIAGEGFSVEKTTAIICGAIHIEAEQRLIGRRFRDGLNRMAREWLGPERFVAMKSFAAEGARPTEIVTRAFEPDPSQRAHVYRDMKTGKAVVTK